MPVVAQQSSNASGPLAIIRSIGGLVFDAVFEEQYDNDLEVTDNPVESGVLVSDHAYMKPRRVSITAGVTDTPLVAIDNDKFQGESRHREAYRLMAELQSSAEPFDVQTGLQLYKNMICTSLRTRKDKDTAASLIFTAELREVLIVSTRTVKYPPRKPGPTKQQAGPKVKKGEQQGKPVEQPKEKSVLKSLSRAVKGATP